MPSNLIKVKATTKVELDRWKKPGMTYDEVIVFLLTVWKVFHSIASGYLENEIGDAVILIKTVPRNICVKKSIKYL